MPKNLLKMQNIKKIFKENNVKAVDSADLVLAWGEIHAIVGENGAGKSTLMHILAGELFPDSGKIYMEDREVEFARPYDSLQNGIGMLHQQLKLIPSLTVLENIILGNEPAAKSGIIDKNTAYQKITELCMDFDINVDPDKRVSTLNSDGKQKTALLSLLFHNLKILILDEPTTFFSETKVDTVHKLIRKLKTRGKSIIIITHKLREAIKISDTITVMKTGRTIAEIPGNRASLDKLSTLIFGTGVFNNLEKHQIQTGPVILEAKKLSYVKDKTELLKINFRLRKFEIVVVSGIKENGLEILEKILSGEIRISSGELLYNNESIGMNSLNLRHINAGYIPSDRIKKGASIKSSIIENMILLKYRKLTKFGLLNQKAIKSFSNNLVKEYGIKGELNQTMGTLSGGNIQRVMIAREIDNNPELFIFAEPSKGLDIKSKNSIYKKIIELKEKGAAVLIISSDTEEAMQLADNLIILHNGKEAAKLSNENINKEYIGKLMLGLEN